MSRLWVACLICLGGWLANPAVALAACGIVAAQDEMTPTELEGRVEQMLPSLTRCQGDATWLAALGHLLNRLNRFADAADHLERALMLEPGLQSAQLDYALALAGLGDVPSAAVLMKDLLARTELPAHLRPILQRQVDKWSGPSGVADDWRISGSAGARLGWDSNLLGAPNLENLTLTLPGQSLVLPLDESYRPVPGAFARTDVQLHVSRAESAGVLWQIEAALRSRTSPVQALARSSQVDLFVERSSYGVATQAGGARYGYYLNASVSALDAQAGTRYQAVGWAAGWAMNMAGNGAGAACQGRIGVELQDRRYSNNQLLSGRYTGLAGVWTCAQSSGAQWLASAKTGRDVASDPDRAGGDQNQATVRMLAYLPAFRLGFAPSALRGYWLADLELMRSRDTGAYSALLDDGAERILQRSTLRLEYQLAQATGWQWSLGAEWVQQHSNLALFSSQSRGPYATLRWIW